MTALITGITGQDGSYLAEFLLEKKYKVYGILRRSSSFNTKRIESILYNENLFLRYGDITDMSNLCSILSEIKENTVGVIEIYNLAAQSHVKVSFELPVYTAQTDAIGTLNLLESIRTLNLIDRVKLYQASTSELYGKVQNIPQDENTPFYPCSPYGVAKLYSYWIIKNYREAYNFHASNGILFNHCSPRRGKTFVTRKITYSIRQILEGKIDYIKLGNLNSKRDWGHAKDYIRAMWLMLQQEKPQDLVISSGETRTIREFAEEAFKYININLQWRYEGVDEEGYDSKTGKVYIKIDPKYFRPVEVDILLGNSSKARQMLNWEPKYSFKDLVQDMMKHDIENVKSIL